MDAHAHLLSLGWAGPGHSLDSRPHLQHKGRRGLAYDPSQHNNTGRGLVKPLLVSQKKNSFGIGKKKHEPAAGNEWWLKGFENALSNIGKNNSGEETSGTATPERFEIAGYTGKHTGLYGFFVKGQQIEGTIREDSKKQARGTKRKSDTFDDQEHESTSSGRSTPKSSLCNKKGTPKGEAVIEFAEISQFLEIRDKDRRRGAKAARAPPTEEFEQMGDFFQAGSKMEKKHSKRSQDAEQSGVFPAVDEASKNQPGSRGKKAKSKSTSEALCLEEKEQKRRERRAAKAAASLSSRNDGTARSNIVGSTQATASQVDGPSPCVADGALRRAERKRRKEQKQVAKVQPES